MLVDRFVYSVVGRSLLDAWARSLCWSVAVGRSLQAGHYESVGRSLWVSRYRLVAMSRCGLVATVGYYGSVALGRLRCG